MHQHAPNLATGTESTVRVRLDADGKPDLNDLHIASSNDVLRGLSAFMLVPVTMPSRANQTIEFVLSYNQGS